MGYGPSNYFIHLNDSYGSVSSISVATGTFKINSFWFYVTGNATQSPGAPNPNTGPGSVIFRGKLGGVTQFTVIKSSGFATSDAAPQKGFALINFATEGNANNANVSIDQLEIELSSNFDYFAIDNFNWAQGALPVTFGAINAVAAGNNYQVSWQTLSETNNDHFEIQASTNGESFKTVASVASKAANGNSDTLINYNLSIDIGGGITLAGWGILSLLGIAAAGKKGAVYCSAFRFLQPPFFGWVALNKTL
ncbi:hypothetical protein [Niabella hibiscisoli]|uniref:hypothetical protein n=1 Tax=Niabella hibiscisoli TaxID=1825928 RepID=UPI001F10E8E3|nr:hypothetical protein [Niabella hibiscisoli]MCH5719979.1 hypothetical protein [Niabella hibiscisoli]